ncbi:SWF/SNF family helicase [Streptococcus pneumoniae]|nr:SWF/SNF family helicase [Streptococcus pneumoniae]
MAKLIPGENSYRRCCPL